jgi:nitroreductase/NAD-dependent dihydropyrimidine dehydrogenase PreA subunit
MPFSVGWLQKPQQGEIRMRLLRVDAAKCNKDGICVRECPSGIIRLEEDNGYPDIVPGGEVSCLVCGHCVAVCPTGALSHESIPIELSPIIKNKLAINEEQAVQFLRSRRSIRFYTDKPVEREKIQRLIEAARYAPTAGNMQLVEWLVLSDKSVINKLAGRTIAWIRQLLKDNPKAAKLYPRYLSIVAAWESGLDSVLRNAPVLVIASAPKKAVNGLVDVTLALCYLDLLAPTVGLGTCWAGLLQGAILSTPSLREVVGIPTDHSHHYPMMLGYPKVKRYTRLPERKQPKITFT